MVHIHISTRSARFLTMDKYLHDSVPQCWPLNVFKVCPRFFRRLGISNVSKHVVVDTCFQAIHYPTRSLLPRWVVGVCDFGFVFFCVVDIAPIAFGRQGIGSSCTPKMNNCSSLAFPQGASFPFVCSCLLSFFHFCFSPSVAYACFVAAVRQRIANGRDLSSASRTPSHKDAVGLEDLLNHAL